MIETATAWLSNYWWVVALVLVIAMKVLNLITQHFKDRKGLVRVCLFLIDLFDVLKSSHGGIPGSRPPAGGGR
jgi:hypothetical protein